MNFLAKKIVAAAILLSLFLNSAFSEQNCAPAEKQIICTTNVLQQLYPDQNACVLFHQIPQDLRHLPYVIYPVCKGYDTARFNYNKRFNIFPHAIITPRSVEEIIDAFNILKKHHLKFSIRSGGHCYEPGSLSSSYVIDLRNFNSIEPNVEREEVYIGAGVLLGPVVEALGKLDFAIPTGSCTSVGVTGLALGGGIGVLDRQFGLTCDSIKNITMLTADGKVIVVDKDNHPDLFWAMRGAGNGSYGIVLGFTFKMHFVPVVSFYRLRWEWDPKIIPDIVQTWQTWVQTLPDSISSSVDMEYGKGKLSIHIQGLKVGPEPFTEWETAFAHLNPKVTILKQRYIDSAQEWADSAPFPFLKAKSEILMEPLSNEPIHSAINYFERLRNCHAKTFAFFSIGAFGGKIPKGHTAFFPRNAFAWWHQIVSWNQQNQEGFALKGLKKFHCEILPFVSPFVYANFADYDLGKCYLEAFYGTHVDRLIRIKNKYDREDLFHWKQGIPLKR